jgi:dCMP deaminase
MKQKFIDAYMDVAHRFAQLSTANRLQVGAIIVKEDRIISIGYNGMPAGWTNECEYFVDNGTRTGFFTKDEVIHAEQNALYKLAGSHECGKDASLFITHSPCIECAKGIYASGISKVYYKQDYRNSDGIEFLKKCGIEVLKLNEVKK